METSLKTGFAQIFSRCPRKSELPKIWGDGSPPRPPGRYAYGRMARIDMDLTLKKMGQPFHLVICLKNHPQNCYHYWLLHPHEIE